MSKGAGAFHPSSQVQNAENMDNTVGDKPSATKKKKLALRRKATVMGLKWEPFNWRMRKTLKKAGNEVKASLTNGSPYSQPKQKTEDQTASEMDTELYKEKMVIAPYDYPSRKFTVDEVETLQEAVLAAFERLEDGCFPQFCGSYEERGAVIMACGSPLTKTWLEELVPKLKPWEDAKLIIRPKTEVVEGNKVLLKTPAMFATTPPLRILQILGHQNKTLKTGKWQIVSVESDDSGQTLIYAIDDESVETIKALENKVYFGLGSVELVFLPKDGTESVSDNAGTQ